MNKLRSLFFSYMLWTCALSSSFYASPRMVESEPGGKQSATTLSTKGVTKESDIPDFHEIVVPPSEMRGLVERYVVDRGSISRSYPVDQSPARRSRFKQFYSQWQGALAKLNFDTMSQAGQVDYILLMNHLDYELRQLDIQTKAITETGTIVPFAQTIADLEESRRRMERIDPAKAASIMAGLNKQIETVRGTVEAGLKASGKSGTGLPAQAAQAIPGQFKKAIANRAVTTISSLRNTLRNWFGFYNGYDPSFTWWVEAPYKTVDKALQDYAALLRERVLGLKPEASGIATAPASAERTPSDMTTRGGTGGPGGFAGSGGRGGRPGGTGAEPGSSSDIIGDPIGHDALMIELAHEMIPYTPEELIEIGNKELAWCESEMKRASRELGYGDDWLKALEHVKSQFVDPGKQPELIRELALEAITFINDRDLVTVPPLARDSWRMEMMSPERQLVNPFFTGGETISVSYPTNTMSQEQKMMSMRGNNIHFSRATVFHEVIPGHHLQGFMTQRYRPYRSVFSTSFWGEGWPLYWELLLYQTDFPKSPENRIGMLFWRMHRCARIIFSLSFHLEKMTPQECIDFLVKRVGHEAENATGEVRRSFGGGYGPLYQAAYLIGGLQLLALHKELVDSRKMTNRAFNDAILQENSIPIEMLRAILTKQKLTRGFSSNWKFYGPK